MVPSRDDAPESQAGPRLEATGERRLVLVTGASGNVGREVVRALRAAGLGVRAAGPNPEELAARTGAAASRLDFRDPSTFAPAVDGCDGVFLMRPPAISDTKRTLNPFVDVALARGVRHVVFLSVAGAGRNKLVPHHAVEAHLQRVSEGWTLLRPGFFAQNLGDAYRRDIVEDGRLYVPAGDGRVTFVDVRDVADVAADAFARPERHRARAYTLTGPAPVTFAEAAGMLSEALGRPIRYEPATVLGYLWHLHRRGLPIAQTLVQMILHVGLRYGQAGNVDPTLQELLGRPPRTLRDYVRDHAQLWRGAPAGAQTAGLATG
jgi:uncharacterized protein YbjT (DUF2867 family)